MRLMLKRRPWIFGLTSHDTCIPIRRCTGWAGKHLYSRDETHIEMYESQENLNNTIKRGTLDFRCNLLTFCTFGETFLTFYSQCNWTYHNRTIPLFLTLNMYVQSLCNELPQILTIILTFDWVHKNHNSSEGRKCLFLKIFKIHYVKKKSIFRIRI